MTMHSPQPSPTLNRTSRALRMSVAAAALAVFAFGASEFGLGPCAEQHALGLLAAGT